jgi:hypothetical protein
MVVQTTSTVLQKIFWMEFGTAFPVILNASINIMVINCSPIGVITITISGILEHNTYRFSNMYPDICIYTFTAYI